MRNNTGRDGGDRHCINDVQPRVCDEACDTPSERDWVDIHKTEDTAQCGEHNAGMKKVAEFEITYAERIVEEAKILDLGLVMRPVFPVSMPTHQNTFPSTTHRSHE